MGVTAQPGPWHGHPIPVCFPVHSSYLSLILTTVLLNRFPVLGLLMFIRP